MAALAPSTIMKRAFVGAVKDEWIMYSDRAEDFTLGQPIGYGASSVVYSAQFKPAGSDDEPVECALKVIDLDILPPHALPLLRRETQLMALSKHPNVLRVRGSWMDGHKLYIALRLMRSGSVADTMHYGWPGGFEEEVVKAVLFQALQGLNYLHINGFIHRDIKAANLLIDDDGTVLLGDLGVAVSMAEDEHNAQSGVRKAAHAVSQPTSTTTSASTDPANRPKLRHKRKSFVGTPCWMAPEVVSQKHYDSQADMWSFGITALELAQGRPPNSRDPSHKALLKIIQDAPPTLDREQAHNKFSKAFSEMVESCLMKDPMQRPTAEQLLASPFFKSVKKKSYLVDKILANLPPLKLRQERRRIPSASSRSSIASWDFSHTVYSHHSPTSTYHHHHRLANTLVSSDAVVEMDDDEEMGLEARIEALRTRNESEVEAKPNAGMPYRPEHHISISEVTTVEHPSSGSATSSPDPQTSPESATGTASPLASSVESAGPRPSSPSHDEIQPISIGIPAMPLPLPIPVPTGRLQPTVSPSPPSPSLSGTGAGKLWRILSSSGKSAEEGSGTISKAKRPSPPVKTPSVRAEFSASATGSSPRKPSFSQRVSDIFSSSTS